MKNQKTRLTVEVNATEKAAITTAAQSLGLSESKYVRIKLFLKQPDGLTPTERKDYLSALGLAYNAAERIAMTINNWIAAGYIDRDDDVQTLLADLDDLQTCLGHNHQKLLEGIKHAGQAAQKS